MTNTHTFTINQLVQLIPVACTKCHIVLVIAGVLERVNCHATYGYVAPDFIFHFALFSSQSELPIQCYGCYTTTCTVQDVSLYRILFVLRVLVHPLQPLIIPIFFPLTLTSFLCLWSWFIIFVTNELCQMDQLHIVISINTKIE